MVTWVLFLGVGLVIGVIAGLYFARLDDVTNSQKKALQQKLDAAEQQLKTYQSQVTDHFLKTAGLVNSMTESYKAVHDHLAVGAKQLCDSQVIVAQLEMPATKLLDNAEPQEAEQAKPEAAQDAEVAEKQASPATDEEAIDATQPEHQDESKPAVQLSDKTRKEPSRGEAVSTEPVEQSIEQQIEQPVEKQAESSKEADDVIQPPSTPESLHMDGSEEEAPKSLKDGEPTAPASVSRMVH